MSQIGVDASHRKPPFWELAHQYFTLLTHTLHAFTRSVLHNLADDHTRDLPNHMHHRHLCL